ncbi:hypothetical protein, partial [Pseudomonas syringae group genomosp. 3]|uniref:hypothetical protein n=1 Tax=Pseudomonas syringae group genomosp. 3 TaxID=251701 RepID=UPI003F4F7DBA
KPHLMVGVVGGSLTKNRIERCGFFVVRQAWRVAPKRNQLGYGGHAGDLEVQVLYTPGNGKR